MRADQYLEGSDWSDRIGPSAAGGEHGDASVGESDLTRR